MKFVKESDGETYTPSGHDENVNSRIIYKDLVDVHTTSFPPGAGMNEEVHEDKTHVFFVLKGKMDVRQDGALLEILQPGESVVILAGEYHEVRNAGKEELQFLAITFPDNTIE